MEGVLKGMEVHLALFHWTEEELSISQKVVITSHQLLYIFIHIFICMYIYLFICIYLFVYLYVFICYSYLFMYLFIYVFICGIYTYKYIYIKKYIFVCIYATITILFLFSIPVNRYASTHPFYLVFLFIILSSVSVGGESANNFVMLSHLPG